MPTDLSPPGTGHAAGSASRKCHARSDCEDRSDPSEDAALGAGKLLVSGSGAQGSNGTPNPTLTTGPQFFAKLLILRPRLQKVFTTVSPPEVTVSASCETILGDGWDGNCRCNWWSSIW